MEDKESKIVRKEKSENFLTSKVFLTMLTFILGALLMFTIVFLTSKGALIREVETKNIKATTLEEVSDLKTAIGNVYESTVYIEVSSERGAIASGSGFVYKKENNYAYILTNYHVIKDGSKYVVTFIDGSEVSAELINGDEYYDIAVLRVSADKILKVANLADSSSVEIGDTVFTVGAPLSKEYMGTITKGIISGVNRKVTVKLSSGNYVMEVIQTDASINTGNSGGPLCNIKGEVIGITSSKLMGSGIEGMGFAIPINSVTQILDGIESGTKFERPYVGVQLTDLNNTFALQYYYNINISKDVEFGAVLSYVEENKPAANAGLKVGDVIVSLDGEKVDDASHFKYLLYKHKLGDTVKVKYYRENSLNETTLELTESLKSE